ncbi:MAG TPA: hypothetical protein PLQ36_01930, partial [Candidatus Gracilibacteria bacterium]|nr:hypothetical protein [Candidatus Gracilibacteria bacterium]
QTQEKLIQTEENIAKLKKDKGSEIEQFRLYQTKIKMLQEFETARLKSSMEGQEADSADYFFNFSDQLLPALSKHLHPETQLEGLSINENAEVMMPIYSTSYTNLAKQYLAWKTQFKEESYPLFQNIKLNTFNRQEKEVLRQDEQRRMIKDRKIVYKAVLSAKINPLYFNTYVDNQPYQPSQPEKKKFFISFLEKPWQISKIIYTNLKKSLK